MKRTVTAILLVMLLSMQVLFPALITADGAATTQTSPQAKSLLLESDLATKTGNIPRHSDDYGLRAREEGADNQPNGDSLSIMVNPCVMGGLTQTPSMIQNQNVIRHEMMAIELEGLKQKFGVGKQEASYNQLIAGHGTGLRAPTEQQWIEIADSAFMAESVSLRDAVQSPPSIDESTKPWFPPIGDQDGEGSCVAWAVGYYMKTFQEAKEHGWNLSGAEWEGGNTGHPTAEYQGKIVSPDFIYHLINFGVDGGSYFYDAMQLVCFIGASSWEKMPYDPADHTAWPLEEAWREAPLFRGSSDGYQYMQVDTDAGLANLKNWLVSDQLVIIGVDANKYSALTSADVWTLDNYVSPSVNHANTVVGYDDAIAYNENGQLRHGAFKIANSWGVGGWENINDGFYWISYEAMKQRISYCMFYDDLVGYKPELAATFRLSHDKRDECDITLGAGNVTSPLITKRFSNYVHGGNQPFCQNDILFDITEFRDSVPTVYNQSYFLQVYDGGSSTTGTIYKFAIEYAQSNTTFFPTVNDNYVYLNVTLPPLETTWGSGTLVNFDQDFTDNRIATATDNKGYLYVAYEDLYPAVNQSAIFVRSSSDGGQNWLVNIIGYDPTYDMHSPSIAIDPYSNDVFVAAEREWTSTDYDIFVLRCIGGSWSWSAVANVAGNDDRFPSITCEYQYGASNWQYISYEYVCDYNDRDLMFAKSTDHGATWSTKKLHGDWPDYNVHAQTSITNAEDYLYIAYKWGIDYDSPCEIRVDRSSDFGNTWTQYTHVDGMANGCSFPSIAATRNGSTVMVAFQYDWSSSDIDVWYSYSTDKGSTWIKGKPLFTSGLENEESPVLLVDGDGTQNSDVRGYFHVVCKVGRYAQYRVAHYSEPTYSSWSTPETITDGWIGMGLAITTRLANGVYHPYVTWIDTRTSNIYCSPRQPRTWTVDHDGSSDLHTIQEAIGAAHPGDIAYVHDGTYYENVVVNKTLSLVGQDMTNTVIDGNFAGNVVNITSCNVNVNGFTIRRSGTTMPNWKHGIYVSETSSGINVSSNIITSNFVGICLADLSSDNSISGNNIANNDYGILLNYSSDNSISGNNIANNDVGVYFYSPSNYNSISGNNIKANNRYGILLESSSNYNSISGNTFTNDGLSVWDSYQNSVENNTVNGRPLVYLEGVSNYTVDDAGQVILVRCDNIRVEGLNLSSTSVGVELLDTSNSTLSGNNIANNGMGIMLHYSSDNSISGNNITANNYHGIWLHSSSDNSISGNNITANNDYGIMLNYSSDNSISGNNITANFGDGIMLYSSSGNKLFHNSFVNNNIQVYSSGSVNIWDDGYPSGGNYWSDYSGIDEKNGPNQDQPGSDGIVDTPYIIDVNNRDRYPLMIPWVAQHDVAITNVTSCKTVVSQGYSLNMNVTAANQGSYVESFFDVYVYASNLSSTYQIGLQTITLNPYETAVLTFTWDTHDLAKGNYTLWAYAEPVVNETETADNTYTDGVVTISAQGDINADGIIDIFDITTVALAFNSIPGDSNWNPVADINSDNIVDIFDIVVVALHFGEIG